MRHIRRSNRIPVQINIVPLLDILLVLLIIFMVTSQAANNEVELNLPQANTKKAGVSTDNSTTIYINSKQEIIVNNEKVADVQNLETFFSLLTIDAQKDNIILASDLDVPYQKIMEVLVALNNVGLTKIKMAYQSK